LRSSTSATGPAIALPRHLGKRGHPVAFSRRVWEELLATPDELGARAVTRRVPGRVVEIDVDDPGVLLDIDTPSDLERLRARQTT
jgi:molybdenum cofactor cytidylyltransferase